MLHTQLMEVAPQFPCWNLLLCAILRFYLFVVAAWSRYQYISANCIAVIRSAASFCESHLLEASLPRRFLHKQWSPRAPLITGFFNCLIHSVDLAILVSIITPPWIFRDLEWRQRLWHASGLVSAVILALVIAVIYFS